MRAAVIVFPGSNCDRDMRVALRQATGRDPHMVWHRDTDLPDVDLIALPGGFSYGDYLRCGAMASHSPVMAEVKRAAERGVHVLGVCNGFQVLTEAGLLPGVLMRNRDLRFVCRDVWLLVENAETAFTDGYEAGEVIRIPVAHHDGNYFADELTLRRLEDRGRIVFRYCSEMGAVAPEDNPNGSCQHIAGIVNEKGNVLGMMPHPERLADPLLGGADGTPMFAGLAKILGG